MRLTLPAPYGDKLLTGEPLAKYTAARLGGPADYVYIARESAQELAAVAEAAGAQAVPVRILGGGANVLVNDVRVGELGTAAETTYRFAVPPAYAESMYDPAAQARSLGAQLAVEAR